MDILKNLDLSLIVGGGYLIFVKYGFGDVEETGILIAIDEILEEKRVRHINSFIEEHPEALKITSGANNVIYKEKDI